jgi:microcystin-dependent protein
MADGFVGEIRAFGFDFVPTGWLPCNGAAYNINQFQALFAIVGVQFGGNGTTNFQVPDLRGKTAVGVSLTATGFNVPGATGGTEQVTIDQNTMPAHTHGLQAVTRSSAAQTAVATETPSPSVYLSNAFSSGLSQGIIAYSNTNTGGPLNPQTIGITGSSLPHSNMSPYLAMTYCICSEGIFPQHP